MATCSPCYKVLLFSTFFVFLIPFSHGYQNDSVYPQPPPAPADTTRIKELLKLAESYQTPRDLARGYALEALDISKKLNYRFGIGLSNYILIDFTKNTDELDEYATTALATFEDLHNMHYKAQVLASTGYAYLDISARYSTALQYARRFMAMEDKGPYDPHLLARGWNLMGEIYRITRNYDKALEAYAEACRLLAGTAGEYTSPFINMATVYKEKGLFEKALVRYDSVLEFLKSTGQTHSSTHAYIQNRKAQVHLLQGRIEKSLLLADESLDLYETLNYTSGRVLALSTLSEAEYLAGNVSRAIEHGVIAIELAAAHRITTEGLDKVARIVADAYAGRNDYANAWKFQKIYTDIHNSIYAPESYVELANQQIKVETEKQELEKQLLEQQARASAAVIDNQKRINFIVIIALVLVSVLSFFLFKNMKTKSRLNYELKEKQDEILQQSEELKAQAEELQAYNEKIRVVNASLEEMVTERTHQIQQQNKRLMEYAHQNAHNVRGPLARILGLIYLMDRDHSDDGYQHYKLMLKEAGEELDKVINEIKKKLENE